MGACTTPPSDLSGKSLEYRLKSSDSKMEPIHLPYTLQTSLGMVLSSGLPIRRYRWNGSTKQTRPALQNAAVLTLPRVEFTHRARRNPRVTFSVSSFKDYAEHDWSSAEHQGITDTAIACLREDCIPDLGALKGNEGDEIKRYVSNVEALRSETMTIHQLMTCIKSRNRLDLEQAAGAVVAAFVNDGRVEDACLLVKELTGVLAVGDMSITQWNLQALRASASQGRAVALSHIGEKLYSWCRSAGDPTQRPDTAIPRSYKDLVTMLLRIRRVAPTNRCLYIPAWLFEMAGITPPPHHASYLVYQAELERNGNTVEGLKGFRYPARDIESDGLILSRTAFRAMQRRIFSLFRFWKPEVRLRHDVHALEDRVLYATDWIDAALRETDDVAPVAFWFFMYQRRLQLKVVSDDHWTRFLRKGEGKTLYQNNRTLMSTFEERLAELAGHPVTDGIGEVGDSLQLIDRACLLMKNYVDIYGGGKKENLVFKSGVWGGKGRGPVDEYNLLCDILKELRDRAGGENGSDVPGPVYKFLAKDIMHYNNSWEDDAFAGGKVHGWENWVVERKLH